MTELRNNLTRQEVADLATDALRHEGVAAYFPNLDPESFDPAGALADLLWLFPQTWCPAEDDSPWECRAGLDQLRFHAIALFGATLG